MSSERELDEGIKSIKSAWRREHTARANLEKMLQQAETENAKLRELCADMWEAIKTHKRINFAQLLRFGERVHELGIEVDE